MDSRQPVAIDPRPGSRIVAPPSMADLATQALRAMILSGELPLGTRLVEAKLTDQLGVSRPPLREALQTLTYEGLVVAQPPRGLIVRSLTQHDVYEIVTLREELESFAVRIGIPVRSPARLDACCEALAAFEAAGREGDEGEFTDRKYAFHQSIVDLAGHRRLTETYRTLSLQVRLCMAMNRAARRDHESLMQNVARHTDLLTVIESGDADAVLRALAEHGHGSFLDVIDELDGPTAESTAWLDERRRGHMDVDPAPSDDRHPVASDRQQANAVPG